MVKGHNCTPFPERNNQIPDEKWIQRFINNKVKRQIYSKIASPFFG
ncbi:hypothetical protein T11_13560 [Trichinella zimbabwensis]|uniref:Uncharacterized protein n=1 Tax=Trichinella zimbabwensis TaxID=268475 RepID=A0A0V1GBE7_9BILA|nr:hypothetical protein T11_13560 [Trichinella zimbabwensis]